MRKAIQMVWLLAVFGFLLGEMTAQAQPITNTQTGEESIWPTKRDGMNLIIGFVLGLLANFIYGRLSLRHERKRLAEKFGWATGDYIGRVKKPDSDELDESKKQARATVTYQRDNMLKIEVTDPANQVWLGEIAMEGEQSGTVAWRYDFPQTADMGERHRFGLKRCIFTRGGSRDSPTTLMYLIGDKSEGYGNEIFVRE